MLWVNSSASSVLTMTALIRPDRDICSCQLGELGVRDQREDLGGWMGGASRNTALAPGGSWEVGIDVRVPRAKRLVRDVDQAGRLVPDFAGQEAPGLPGCAGLVDVGAEVALPNVFTERLRQARCSLYKEDCSPNFRTTATRHADLDMRLWNRYPLFMTRDTRMSIGEHLGIPNADDINELVRRSVLALAEGEGISREALQHVVGISRSAMFGKLATSGARPFTAAEVAQLAAFFEVPVTDFFDGLGGRIRLGRRRGDRIVRLPVTSATATSVDNQPTEP